MSDRSASDASTVDWQTEEEWGRLRTQLDFANDFWLGFLFASPSAPIGVIRDRADAFLRGRGKTLHVIQPESAEELRQLARALLEPLPDFVGCVWVEGAYQKGSDSAAWASARDTLLVTLNEHREPLMRQIRAGLVFTFSAQTKPRVREVAPDLWSVRSLVMHLNPQARRTGAELALLERPASKTAASTSAEGELALASAGRLLRDGEWSAAIRFLLRAADSLEKANDFVAARAATRKALEVAEEHDKAFVPQALVNLGAIEISDGDSAAAIDHLRRAADFARALGDVTTGAYAFFNLSGAYYDQASLSEAVEAARAAVELFRSVAADAPLAAALHQLGYLLVRSRDLAGAREAFQSAVSLMRSNREQGRESLPSTLGALAQVLVELGDIEGARRAAEEIIGLGEVDAPGISESPVAAASWVLGRIARIENDYTRARGQMMEARRIEELREPDISRSVNIGSILRDLARTEEAAGDVVAAKHAWEEAVSVSRAGAAQFGDDRRLLAGLATALSALSRHLTDEQKERVLAEVVAIARRLAAATGELEPLADALNFYAHNLVKVGPERAREAAQLFRESSNLYDRLRSRNPADADMISGFASAVAAEAQLAETCGDPSGALARYRVAAPALQDLLSHGQPRTSDVQLLAFVLDRLAEVTAALGTDDSITVAAERDAFYEKYREH